MCKILIHSNGVQKRRKREGVKACGNEVIFQKTKQKVDKKGNPYSRSMNAKYYMKGEGEKSG